MGNLKKLTREMVEAAEKIVAPLGGTCRFEHGKTHGKLYIELNGMTRFTPIPVSPRSTDAIHQKMSDVRRLIREMAS